MALGMLWYPFIQRLDTRWLHAVLALSAGVLAFLVGFVLMYATDLLVAL